MQHKTRHRSNSAESVSASKKYKKESGHEKRQGLYSVTLCASLHVQMAEQGTSVRKGKAEPGKGCGGDQACSIVLYFYSCIGNFSCWQSALASHTLSPFLRREERKKEGELNKSPL